MKRWLLIAGGALMTLAVSFIAGRYTAPARTVEKIRTVTETKIEYRYHERAIFAGTVVTHRQVIEHRWPSGESTTTTTEDTTTNASGSTETSGEKQASQTQVIEREKIVEARRPNLRVSVAGAWSLSKVPSGPPDLWAAEGQARILGPLWLGPTAFRVAGETYVGGSIGVEF